MNLLSLSVLMPFPLYQVDSFTDQLFSSNPSAICLLEEWLPDLTMLQIAAENCLPDTAFVVPSPLQSHYSIRRFTPEVEMGFVAMPHSLRPMFFSGTLAS